MSVTIQWRRDLAANWTSANPVLHQGEAGLETDTGMAKMGDGATAWTSLAYWNPSGSTGVQLAGDLGNTDGNPRVVSTHLASPLPIAQGGTGTATGAAQNNVLAGPVSGSGAPSFRALASGDLPTATTSAQGAVILDGTSGDIQPTGSAAVAGSTGKAADAGHVHVNPSAPGTTPATPIIMQPVKWLLYNQPVGPTRLTYTYNNGTNGTGATITANSNGALSFYFEPGNNSLAAVGDRVLLSDSYTDGPLEPPYADGIYVITSLGSASTPWVMTRSSDMNTPATIGTFWAVQITAGALWGGGWAQVVQLFGAGPDVPWSLSAGELWISVNSQQGAAIGPGGMAPGQNAVAVGQNSLATGEESASVGTTSTSAGKISTSYAPYSSALGEYSATLGYKGVAYGQQSIALGCQSLSYVGGMIAESGGDINNPGDSQLSRTLLICETSNATPTGCVTGPNGSFQFVTSSGSATYSRCALITITVVAYRTDVKGTASAWTAGPALLVGNGSAYAWATGSAPTFSVVQQNSAASGWAVSVAVSGNTLTVTVTGQAGETIDWTAVVQMVETA